MQQKLQVRTCQLQTDHFLGVPKLFLAALYRQTSWQLRVQLSSFKIDAKMALTCVKASLPGLPDQPQHPQAFQANFPILTMRIIAFHMKGYGQCKVTPSLVLRALSELFAVASKHDSEVCSKLSSSYCNFCIRNNLRRPEAIPCLPSPVQHCSTWPLPISWLQPWIMAITISVTHVTSMNQIYASESIT